MADCTREGECSPAAKRREIVGRNGSAWRFDPFANQIAIIDGNNHTVETISPRISASLPPSPSLPLFDLDFFPPCLIQGNPRPCLTHRRCIDGRKMLTIFFCVNTIFFFLFADFYSSRFCLNRPLSIYLFVCTVDFRFPTFT